MAEFIYVPEAQRDRRQPGWKYYGQGFCRLCSGPIIVPRGKLKAAALRSWKRLRRTSFDELGSNLVLYKPATWHPWCWSHAAALSNPYPRGIAKAQGRAEDQCYQCTGPGPCDVDHIVPLWAGGRHRLSNLQVLCQPCHREKTAREALLRARAKRVAEGKPVQQEFAMGGPA